MRGARLQYGPCPGAGGDIHDLDPADRFSELSDEDMTDSDSDDEPEMTAEERRTRLEKLVPSLPPEEWGRKTHSVDEDVVMKTRVSSKETPLTDTLLPAIMRPPVFERQEYDGAVMDSDSDEEEELPPANTLGHHIAQMKWGDGATPQGARIEEIHDSDGAESDAEDDARARRLRFDDDIDEQMARRVWGAEAPQGQGQGGGEERKDREVGAGTGTGVGEEFEDMDVDMGDEEEDFIRFSRETLGIDDEMWERILNSRRERGGECVWSVVPLADFSICP